MPIRDPERRRQYDKEWRQRPHVKEARRAYRRKYEEQKLRENPNWRKERQNKYYVKEKHTAREWRRRQTPEYKEKLRKRKGWLDPGVCHCCGQFADPLCRDHSHTTGLRRGDLCTNCNLLLGHAKDNTEILKKAIEYLEQFQGSSENNSSRELAPSMDGLLARERAATELRLLRSDGDDWSIARTPMLDGHGCSQDLSPVELASDRTIRDRQINFDSGHGNQESNRPVAEWTAQADGIGREEYKGSNPSGSLSKPSRFDSSL